jgi:predicted  nucleic acid-binding Zn-ribbon protein
MEKLTKEELQRALGGLERDRSALIDRLWTLKREKKELEDELDYSYDNIQDIKKRIRDLKKSKI